MRRLTRITNDRSGNVTLLFAGALSMMIGVAALGVDTGTLFLEKRRLQGVADAAALAAANDIANSREAALSAIAANKGNAVTLDGVTTGSYSTDISVPPDQRFVAGGTPGAAAKVVVRSRSPAFFSRVFTGNSDVTISAHATAARIDLAAISIGSRLVAVNGGLPNQLLSGLAGTSLNLSVMDYNALVSGKVDVLRFAEALRTQADLNVASFGEVFDARVTLPQVFNALASASGDAVSAATLRAMAGRLPANALNVSSLIDLGPLGNEVHADPAKPVFVDAFSIARALLEVGGQNRQVALDVDLGLPGLASSRLTLAIGQRPAHSPWLSVSADHQITVRTAQTRLYFDTRLASQALLGLGSIRVPIFVELAEAQATLTDVSCARGAANATATLDVTPSVGQVAIADLDTSNFSAFDQPVNLRKATLVSAPLTTVTAYANIKLGGVSAQSVSFNADDIANYRAKTVSTNDLAQGVAASLINNLQLNAQIIGIGLNAQALTSTIAATLGSAASPLDDLINQVSALAGVHVGQADVWVNGTRCGAPMIVA